MSADIVAKSSGRGRLMAASPLMGVVQIAGALFVVVSLLVLAVGANPLSVTWNIVHTPFESLRSVERYLLALTPILLISCGLAIAFRGGLYNIGGDGQFLMGGIVGAGLGIELANAPSAVAAPLVLVVGALGGAAWGALSGWLRGRYGVSEVLTSLLLLFIADFILRYLIRDPWRDGFLTQSARLPDSAKLPNLPGLDVHIGLLLGLGLVPLLWATVNHTPFGFRLQAIGANEEVARASGISVERTATMAMALSGACAGIAGAIQVVHAQGRLTIGLNSALGFTAIVVVLVARMRAFGVLVASAFIVMLIVGSESLQRSEGLSSFIVPVIQALAILIVLVVEKRRTA